jgi:hypothetical protein
MTGQANHDSDPQGCAQIAVKSCPGCGNDLVRGYCDTCGYRELRPNYRTLAILVALIVAIAALGTYAFADAGAGSGERALIFIGICLVEFLVHAAYLLLTILKAVRSK